MGGTKARIEELFGAHASKITTTSRDFVFRYRSVQHWMEVFKTYYGPMLKAFPALDADAGARLNNDILALLQRFNRSGDATLVAPGEYLEVVVVRG